MAKETENTTTELEDLQRKVAEQEALLAEQDSLIAEIQATNTAGRPMSFYEEEHDGQLVKYQVFAKQVIVQGQTVDLAGFLAEKSGRAAELVEKKSELLAVFAVKKSEPSKRTK